MSISDGFAGSVGNTPLIRLRAVSEETGCEILGKAEFMNPGGSVKDRAARAIIQAAERRGQLPPKGTVVEGTAGNTGIGLAHMCNARGYRCVIVMPDNQAPEKYKLLEMLGAEVHKVPTVPYSNPNQYQKVAQRLAASLPNAIWSNQFDNTDNREAHVQTTGPEIWAQTNGRVDAFVAASGTGGTFAGVSEYLKSKKKSIRCVLADPPGSSLYSYVRSGTLKATGTGSITEGIGIGRITANLKDAQIDDSLHVEDADTRAVRVPAVALRRFASRQHQRHQRRCRRARGVGVGTRAYRRDHPVRRRCQVSVAVVQPGMVGAEGPVGPRGSSASALTDQPREGDVYGDLSERYRHGGTPLIVPRPGRCAGTTAQRLPQEPDLAPTSGPSFEHAP